MAIFNSKRCIGMTKNGICKYTGYKCRPPKRCFLSIRLYQFYKRLIRKKVDAHKLDASDVLDKEQVHFRVLSKRMATGKKW